MATKTVRRDWLKRQAMAGKLVCVASHHFDDMAGEKRTSTERPVYVIGADRQTKEGHCNLFAWDFQSSCGTAWRNPDGTITLYVHSNCDFTFRVI